MVLSVVAATAIFAGPAAAQSVSNSDRTISAQQVSPGDTVQVTVEATIGSASSGDNTLSIDETFSPEFDDSAVTDFQVNGQSTLPVGSPSDGSFMTVADERDYEAGDTVTVTYEVEVPNSASDGDTFSIDGDVTIDGQSTQTTGPSTITVDTGGAGPFAVSNLNPVNPSVEPDQDITVSADVTNQGSDAGSTQVRFTVDGTTVATQQTSNLAAGASETVSFDVTAPSAEGDYTHAIETDDDTQSGTLTVTTGADGVDIASGQRTIVSAQSQHFDQGDFDDPNIQVLADGPATQTLRIDFDDFRNVNENTDEVLIDFSQTLDAGVEVTDLTVGSGPIGTPTDVEVDNNIGEALIEFDTAGTPSGVQTVTLELQGDVSNNFNSRVNHRVEIEGDRLGERYRLVQRGATAIAYDDVNFALPFSEGQGAELVDPIRPDPSSGLGQYGAFFVRQGEQLTFQVENPNDRVHIYEYVVEQQADGTDTIVRGSQIDQVGTAPGSLTNYDTSQLEANERYIIDFPDSDEEEVAILDVNPLNLNATFAKDEFVENEEVQLDVTSEDIGGSAVSAFVANPRFTEFYVTPADQVGQGFLDGDGDETFLFNSTSDLDGLDDYAALVEHNPSEVRATSGVTSVVEAPDERVTIASPLVEDDSFARGDIVPIQLEFENTDTGTLTIGDRTDPQNFEIHVTVRDTDGDGTATILWNTFQAGDGAYTSTVQDEVQNGGSIPEGESCEARGLAVDECDEIIGSDDDRNHGIFVPPGETGTSLVGPDGNEVVAHGPSLDIEGGSTGGAVIFPQNYDLVSTSGDDNYKAEDQFTNDVKVVRLQEGVGDGIDLWTAPGLGENEIDPEFASDVTDAIDDGIITPADGAIADRDFMVLQVQVTGLEGIMHEAVLQDPDLDTEDFLDREEDHLVTEEFFAAQNLTTRDGSSDLLEFFVRTQETRDSVENRTAPNKALDPVTLDIQDATSGVVAGADSSGNLNQFFIPINLENGNDLVTSELWLPSVPENSTVDEAIANGEALFSTGEAELRPGLEFDSTFVLDPSNADQVEVIQNDPLANGFEDAVSGWNYVRGEAFVEGADPILVVPQEDGIEISGSTSVAAGTNLTISLQTAPAEDPPFFKLNPAVFPEYQEGANNLNTWSITEDFADFDVGTSFEMKIRRTGAAGQLTYFTTPAGADPAPVPGAIGQVREVQEFTFSDQDSGGQSVVIDSFQAPYDSIIQIQDSSGNVLGTSDVIASSDSPRSRIAVSLDEDITENQELTAVAQVAGGIDYPNGERTAQITVEELDEAEFQVNSIDPEEASIDAPAEVTVTAEIENVGDLEGTQDVLLTAGGAELDSTEVTLGGGESTSVDLTVSADALEYGTTYFHTVETDDDSLRGALQVAEEVTPTPTVTPTETATPMDTDTPADSDDSAGFGIVVALLAFLGAALLAARRRYDS